MEYVSSDEEGTGIPGCGGIQVEMDFFANPYIHDPVLGEEDIVAFDVQGSKGTNIPSLISYRFPVSWVLLRIRIHD
jgi:hypothetical protein